MPATTFIFLTLIPSLFIQVAARPAARSACSKGRSASNPKCCVWYDVLDEVQEQLFSGGECDEVAHDALRLTFHDAIGFSPQLTAQGAWGGGGADGSIIAFSDTEFQFHGNAGLEETVEDERPIALKYNVSFGDIIQFAGAVSVRNCAGGPRLEFLAGRPDAVQASPDGLLPDPSDSVDKILARMKDAGFSAQELVDLLASHSIGFQEQIDHSIEFTPFDSSVEVFDSQFFLETLLKGTLIPGDGLHPGQALSPIPGEFRLQSDFLIARDPRTACRWQSFILNESLMATSFKKAMAKLAIVGQDKSRLTDCSEVIPPPTRKAPRSAHLPPNKTIADIEFSCKQNAMPKLTTDSGPVVTLAPAFSDGTT